MPLKKRSLKISGHATSISLEDEFWVQLDNIAKQKQLSIPILIAQIDEQRQEDQNLSSAIRVYILQQLTKH